MSDHAAVRVRASKSGAAFMRRLRIDHSGLSRILREIDTQQAMLRSSPGSARPLLAEAMRYLLQYQHAFHHPREDRLFARIEKRAPQLRRDMRRLARQHRVGRQRAEQLAADLHRFDRAQLQGGKGARLARQLRNYVRHTREHMRREEAVFYARSEDTLDASDWRQLAACDTASDPMQDLQRLETRYPLLAKRLAQPVRQVGGPGPAAARAHLGAVLWRGLEQFVELYGGLTHDALELARANFDSVRAIRSPADIVRVARPIHARNCRFAGRCVMQPVYWARGTVGTIVAAWHAGGPVRRTAAHRPGGPPPDAIRPPRGSLPP